MRLICLYLVVVTLPAMLLVACDAQPSSVAVPTTPSPTATPVPAPAIPAPPTINLTGLYTLTLSLSPSCTTVVDQITHQPASFPSVAQTRSYDAQITQRGGQLAVLLTPAACRGGYYESGVCTPLPAQDSHTRTLPNGGTASGTVSGHELTFEIPPTSDVSSRTGICSGGDEWWESFTATEVFDACGTWRASVDDPARIIGTVDGTFGYLQEYPDLNGSNQGWKSELYCQARDHQFTLTKP